MQYLQQGWDMNLVKTQIQTYHIKRKQKETTPIPK